MEKFYSSMLEATVLKTECRYETLRHIAQQPQKKINLYSEPIVCTVQCIYALGHLPSESYSTGNVFETIRR